MLNRTRVHLFLIFFGLTLFSCKSKEVAKHKNDPDLTFQTNLIMNKSYNQDKSMILEVSFKSDLNPIRNIDYKVLETKSKKVLKEGTFTGIKLEWFTKNQLKGYLFAGMVENDSDAVLLGESGDKSLNKNILIIDIK
tara:strand:+ start:818 stop:1228 length:411 start_codon:yes stop_codon:yes gene_type:complete